MIIRDILEIDDTNYIAQSILDYVDKIMENKIENYQIRDRIKMMLDPENLKSLFPQNKINIRICQPISTNGITLSMFNFKPEPNHSLSRFHYIFHNAFERSQPEQRSELLLSMTHCTTILDSINEFIEQCRYNKTLFIYANNQLCDDHNDITINKSNSKIIKQNPAFEGSHGYSNFVQKK